VLTIRLSGDLDESTAAIMRCALRQAESLPVRTVVVDAARLGYMDATGLGTLAGAYRRLRDQNVGLQLTHISLSIRRVIAVVGFEAMLKAA
jgi:anti-sigma B factor antagonist